MPLCEREKKLIGKRCAALLQFLRSLVPAELYFSSMARPLGSDWQENTHPNGVTIPLRRHSPRSSQGEVLHDPNCHPNYLPMSATAPENTSVSLGSDHTRWRRYRIVNQPTMRPQNWRCESTLASVAAILLCLISFDELCSVNR